MSKTYSDGTGGVIVCQVCAEPVNIKSSEVTQHPPFNYVHRKCEQSEALADMAKIVT